MSPPPAGLGLYNMFPMGADAQTFAIDTFAEPIRRFVEGCDALQGYHMTCDALGAFGGLTHRLVETQQAFRCSHPIPPNGATCAAIWSLYCALIGLSTHPSQSPTTPASHGANLSLVQALIIQGQAGLVCRKGMLTAP